MLEVMDEMAISEKEMKLLMNFVKDDLKEARDSEDVEKKNSKIDRVLEHIQQYLEDQKKRAELATALFLRKFLTTKDTEILFLRNGSSPLTRWISQRSKDIMETIIMINIFLISFILKISSSCDK